MNEKSPEGGNERQKPRITEGLVVAAIPVVGYAIAFCFQLGYHNAFKLPIEFISLRLVDVLYATYFLIVSVFCFGYLAYGLLSPLWSASIPSPIKKRIEWNSPLIVIGLAVFLLYGTTDYVGLIPIEIGIILTVVLNFGLPLIRFRNEGSWQNRYLAADKESNESNSLSTVFDWLVKTVGPYVTLLIVILPLVFLFVYHLGQSSALKQGDFLVLKTNPEMVVLRVLDERLICTQFDRTTGEIGTHFRVIKLDDVAQYEMGFEKIGPLVQVETLSASTPTPMLPGLTPSPTGPSP